MCYFCFCPFRAKSSFDSLPRVLPWASGFIPFRGIFQRWVACLNIHPNIILIFNQILFKNYVYRTAMINSSFSLDQGGVPPFGGEGVLGEPTLEVRAEDKLVYTMLYEEEEDRVCEVKCPKGGGVCGIGATPILLPIVLKTLRPGAKVSFPILVSGKYR